MTSNDNARPALFLATSTADGADGSVVTFDDSEEAMRRLRHPFAVQPAPQSPAAGDDSNRRG
ncbi:hypothetical protein AB0B57_21360 [Micromonospora sp. NPDC049101]|uniref:hypothetical protein n=1 Tax=Micromonospora sp. NPDC049101 TaxID=3155032 RepID=UPI00340168A1